MKPALDRSAWFRRFARNVALWLVPSAVAWLVLTPFYNVFLTKSTENLVRLTEGPAVTRLQVKDTHYFVVTRTDLPTSRGFLSSVRVTDTHFPLIMTLAFFLAVPAVSWRRRLENLGWASLISIFFHILSLLLWVKFVYVGNPQVRELEAYSSLQVNGWGLAKHLADLPFKFAMPLLLWSAFYIRQLLPTQR
ncbi:MAG: hypothetical protein AAGD06_00275 [Acidobacteriota bacterium]